MEKKAVSAEEKKPEKRIKTTRIMICRIIIAPLPRHRSTRCCFYGKGFHDSGEALGMTFPGCSEFSPDDYSLESLGIPSLSPNSGKRYYEVYESALASFDIFI